VPLPTYLDGYKEDKEYVWLIIKSFSQRSIWCRSLIALADVMIVNENMDQDSFRGKLWIIQEIRWKYSC